MTTMALSARPSARRNGRLEPLENGETLTAPEFLRRYEDMPHIKKAELIEGVVYMGSPVRTDVHAAPDNLIQTWLGTYAAATPGTQAVANATVQLDIDNVPQPDALLRITEACGGATSLDEKGYLAGPPELIVEIAASTSAIDLHAKLQAYRRNGVLEYVVWRTVDQAVDWFVLSEGEYHRAVPDDRGLLPSHVFPGLILNVTALLAQNGAALLNTLRTGLKSKAHKTFTAALAARKRKKQ